MTFDIYKQTIFIKYFNLLKNISKMTDTIANLRRNKPGTSRDVSRDIIFTTNYITMYSNDNTNILYKLFYNKLYNFVQDIHI